MWQDGIGVLDWLRAPRADRGIWLYGQPGWQFYSYRELGGRALGTARELAGLGFPPGARIGVAVADPVRFLPAFFGVLASGATAVPVAPPTALGVDYPRYAGALLRSAAVSAVLAPEEMQGAMAAAVQRSGLDVPVLRPAETAPGAATSGGPPRAGLAELAMIQFTSGSTSAPRGVLVTREALEAQLDMLGGWLGWGPDEVTASWLPLYHDMGLVGEFLSPVCHQSDLWQMSPTEFIRDPLSFVRCIGENDITITAMPSFGFAHIARRVRPDQLAGTDFTRFRAAVASAERIDPRALASFARLLGGRGFRPEGLRAAYGLAEATLTVAGASAPRVVEADWATVRMGATVRLTPAGPVTAGRAGLVSCGHPLARTDIWITGDDDEPLPDGRVGEIAVRSPSAALGYVGGEPGSTRITPGGVLTGDAGFIDGGELFVIGRIADSIKVRGQSVCVEQLEDSLAEAAGLPVHKCAVVPGHDADGDSVIAVLAGPPDDAAVRAAVAVLTGMAGARLRVYRAGPHGIPMTTSGKKRRRPLAESILAGTFSGELAYDSAPLRAGAR